MKILLLCGMGVERIISRGRACDRIAADSRVSFYSPQIDVSFASTERGFSYVIWLQRKDGYTHHILFGDAF